MISDPEHREVQALQDTAALAGKRVLEIGCGDGRLTRQYSADAWRVTGVDIDAAELRTARAGTWDASIERGGFARASATGLPFQRSSFEVVIYSWSF